jgi:hypothetical protein
MQRSTRTLVVKLLSQKYAKRCIITNEQLNITFPLEVCLYVQVTLPARIRKLQEFSACFFLSDNISVVDQHLFDTDPAQGATFHFDADPDPDPRIVPQGLHMLKNLGKIFVDFYSQQCRSTLFHLSLQCNGCHGFQYFGQFIKLFWKIV